MARITQFLKETQSEMKHVRWPATRHAWILTSAVVVFSLFAAAYLGLFDYLFTEILTLIV